MIDVLEQLELDRVAGPVDRLDAVDHRPPHAADEIAVEEGDRGREPPGQLGLPVVPGVEIQVAARYPPAPLLEDVQVIAAGPVGIEEMRPDRPARSASCLAAASRTSAAA